jgi:hypothetical protein
MNIGRRDVLPADQRECEKRAYWRHVYVNSTESISAGTGVVEMGKRSGARTRKNVGVIVVAFLIDMAFPSVSAAVAH